MFYGQQAWDPVLIVAQIVTLQCLFYLSFGLLLYLLLGPYVAFLDIQHCFNAKYLSVHSFVGWMVILSNIFNAFAAAIYLLLVVVRAKKCLDFSVTLYLLHLVMVTVIAGFPKTLTWWLVNLCSLAVTGVLGEWLCLQRELREIPIGSALANKRVSGPDAIGSLTMVTALTGALFGRKTPSGAVQLPTRNAAARDAAEEQV